MPVTALPAALEDIVTRFERDTGIRTDFTFVRNGTLEDAPRFDPRDPLPPSAAELDEFTLPSRKARELESALREALASVRTHRGRMQVQVKLSVEPARWTLFVSTSVHGLELEVRVPRPPKQR